MQENEFEKEVQQKMDELKFSPSGEVWKNVVAAIEKRKKDRKIFALIFLYLFIIGTGIFIQLNSTSNKKNIGLVSDKNSPVKANSIGEPINNSDKERNATATKKGKPENKNSEGDEVITVIDNSETKKISDSQKTAPGQSIIMASVKKNHKNTNRKIVFAENERRNISVQKNYTTKPKLSSAIVNSNPEDLADDTISPGNTVKSISGNNILPINDVAVQMQTADSIAQDKIDVTQKGSDTVVTVSPSFTKKDTASANQKQVKQKDGWEFGLNFSFGATTTQNGFLGIGSSGNTQAYTYAPAPQTAGGYPGQINNAAYNPSTINPGAGIVLGVFVQKNISLKTKILIGLNYQTYSSIMMTGSRVDSGSLGNTNNSYSLDNSYYRSGSSNRYKNNFHFLELPVAFQFTLSKQNKLPIYLNTGISVAQLIGSTALQFDAATGNYFSDNSPLNKTQFNLSTGLLFSISGQAKNSLLIGPDISYSVSKVASSGLFNNHHYSYIGVLIQKTIGKK